MTKPDGDKPLMSSDFTWDVNTPERTHELFERYDVRKAKQIIVASPRAVDFVDLKKHGAAIRAFMDGLTLRNDVDWHKIDVTVPVIFVRTQAGTFAIDGRHRLAKALKERHDFIAAVFLTMEETDSIHETFTGCSTIDIFS
jgi:hypothetical protein